MITNFNRYDSIQISTVFRYDLIQISTVFLSIKSIVLQYLTTREVWPIKQRKNHQKAFIIGKVMTNMRSN